MILRIRNLKLRADVGAFHWEKGVKQDIILNIEYVIDGAAATREDKLENTVDYHPLAEKIIRQVEQNRFNIIEYLAAFVLDIVLGYDKRIREATVEVNKPGALPYADATSATISGKR